MIKAIHAEDHTGVKIACVFGVIGVGLLIAAGYFYRANHQLATEGETALGTVVDFRDVRGRRRAATGRGNDPSNFEWHRAPVIRFTSRDGQVVVFPALLGTYPEGLEPRRITSKSCTYPRTYSSRK